MRSKNVFFSLILVGCLAGMLASCYQQKPGAGPQKAPAVAMALKAPKDAPNRTAAMKNDEGVSHLVQEHWKKSNEFFREALQADPNLAEAHFNLGLSLDAMEEHPKATEHFKKASELGANNPKIAENEILKAHL